jgi:hypothetical protein
MSKRMNGTSETKSPSKTDFVLGLPPDMPVSDVLAKAEEAGITIAKHYVYLIRSKAKAGGTKGKGVRKARAKKATASRATPRVAVAASTSIEAQFAGLVAEIGLARAEEMLRSVRTKFTSVAG